LRFRFGGGFRFGFTYRFRSIFGRRFRFFYRRRRPGSKTALFLKLLERLVNHFIGPRNKRITAPLAGPVFGPLSFTPAVRTGCHINSSFLDYMRIRQLVNCLGSTPSNAYDNGDNHRHDNYHTDEYIKLYKVRPPVGRDYLG
jgi:hypothetical protein